MTTLSDLKALVEGATNDWRLDKDDGDRIYAEDCPDGGDIVCEAPELGCEESRARWTANAALICTAVSIARALVDDEAVERADHAYQIEARRLINRGERDRLASMRAAIEDLIGGVGRG